MKNKGVIISLAVIVLIGILITKGTYLFIKNDGSGSGMTAQITEYEGGMAGGAADEPVQEKALDLEVVMEQEGSTEPGKESEADRGDMEKAKQRSLLTDNASLKEENSPSNFVMADQELKEYPEEAVLIEGEDFVQNSISPLDTAPVKTAGEAEILEMSEDEALLEEPQSYYKKRLQDLDSEIEKNRESQASSSINSSARSAASNELKLWDSELNTIYNAILEHLDKERSEFLITQQRAWMKERDALAMEAAKNSSGGSSESVEYTISLIESTRLRAYELVEEYEIELEE